MANRAISKVEAIAPQERTAGEWPAIDPRALRDAAGSFATGVTIVTTRDDEGAPVGLTANSYSSVSLDPPLVLWSLAKKSRAAAAFLSASHFAIHVLGDNQQELAMRFASATPDRFSGLEHAEGMGRVPVLTECRVRLECSTWDIVDGGDHHIFIGRVVAIRTPAEARGSLVFLKGQFHSL